MLITSLKAYIINKHQSCFIQAFIKHLFFAFIWLGQLISFYAAIKNCKCGVVSKHAQCAFFIKADIELGL